MSKSSPTHIFKLNLLALGQEHQSLLLDTLEKTQRRLKALSYPTSNKAGKRMAVRLRGHRTKAKIPFILHPVTKAKILDSQGITNAFSSYYDSLYNLKNYTSTPQPSPAVI